MLAASLSKGPTVGRETLTHLWMSSVFCVDRGGCCEYHTGARSGLRTASKWWILRAVVGEAPRSARVSPPSNTHRVEPPREGLASLGRLTIGRDVVEAQRVIRLVVAVEDLGGEI